MEASQRFERGPVLLVTGDPELASEVRRLAAGAAVQVEVAPHAEDALGSWQRASLVLVGGDCAGSVARLRPSKRRHVSVVNVGSAQPDIFRSAFDLGAAQVLELPTTRDWLAEAVAQSATAQRSAGAVIGVLSAVGGAGSTVLAAAIAGVAAASTPAALVDLDPIGMGIERVVGYDGRSVTTWDTLGVRTLNGSALREALPVHEGVHLVGFGGAEPRPVMPAAVASVLDVCPQAFGITVIDIPRILGDAGREAVDRCDLLVVLCPQSVGAVAAGRRLLRSIQRIDGVVLVTRSGPRTIAPREVADELSVRLLIDVGDQRGLDEALAVGAGPLRSRGSGLRRAAHAVLEHVAVAA